MTKFYVLDVEASGLHSASFPISVAWGCQVDQVECHVIRPEPSWFDSGYGWDHTAEAIHGFTIEHLLEKGEPAFVVARRLAEMLNGRLVLSDAPEFDRAWLDRLHSDTGIERNYDIEHIARRLGKVYDPFSASVAYEALRRQAFERSGVKPHTADGDVKALLTMLAMVG